MVAGVFVIRAALVKNDPNRGPRSAAELATSDAEAAVSKNPRSADARIKLGNAYAIVGRYSDAIKQLRLAENLDPQNADALFLLGSVYRKSGDYSSAILYLKKAAASKDQLGVYYSDVNFELGQAYYDNREYKKAIAVYNKAIEAFPLDSDVIFEMARAYEGLGDKKEAISRYKEAMTYEPQFAEARQALIRLGVQPKDIPTGKAGGFQ
ncbi:MAG: tetratricopeptide repeat protein [Actinomycetota bacterium]|nr:tetratricopeptide repeat protein [Actinomycetota bacterium]